VRTLAYGISAAQQKSVAVREVASRFQALSDVLAQRPTAGVTPQLEARIIDANTLAFRRQERDASLAIATTSAELNQLCGRPADAPLTMAAVKVQFRAASLPALLSAARANAFDVRIKQRADALQLCDLRRISIEAAHRDNLWSSANGEQHLGHCRDEGDDTGRARLERRLRAPADDEEDEEEEDEENGVHNEETERTKTNEVIRHEVSQTVQQT